MHHGHLDCSLLLELIGLSLTSSERGTGLIMVTVNVISSAALIVLPLSLQLSFFLGSMLSQFSLLLLCVGDLSFPFARVAVR